MVAPPTALLWPATLSSGPESGLCNQLYALIGWFILLSEARSHWSGIVLPSFTSHDTNGTSVAFSTLFDARTLGHTMWTRHRLAVWDCGQCTPDWGHDNVDVGRGVAIEVQWGAASAEVEDMRPASARGPPGRIAWRPPSQGALGLYQTEREAQNRSRTFWSDGRSHGGALEGWRRYKDFSARRNLLMNASGLEERRRYVDPRTHIEEAVYAGLRPSQQIQQRVREAKASLGLQGRPYGCMHARIERDMLASWTVNRAGRPPRLSSYLDSIARFPELHGVQVVFVAVGGDITDADRQTLDHNRTSWGAQLVRSSLQKSMPKRRDGSESSYTEASLVDLQICRGAAWLVGFGGSTFTRVAARSRPDGTWIATCPNPADTRVVTTDEGIDKWALCPPSSPAKGHVRCSFGLQCDDPPRKPWKVQE